MSDDSQATGTPAPTYGGILTIDVPGVPYPLQFGDWVDDRVWSTVYAELVCPRFDYSVPHEHVFVFVRGVGMEWRAVQGEHRIVHVKAIAKRPNVCACGARFGRWTAKRLNSTTDEPGCRKNEGTNYKPKGWANCRNQYEDADP